MAPRALLCAVLFLAALLSSCTGIRSTPDTNTDSDRQPPPPTEIPRSPIRHLIVIVLQNRSFDHLFGTFPGVDGARPGVPGYSQLDANGVSVQPFRLSDLATPDLPHSRSAYVRAWNSGRMDQYAYYNGAVSLGYYDGNTEGIALLWDWARQYALADRYFASVLGNAPANPLYMVAANDNNNPDSRLPAYGPCNGTSNLASPYTFPNVGDQLSAAQFPWMWFQENYGTCADYVPQQNPFQYFTSTYSSGHIANFDQFYQRLASGDLPAVSFLQPAPYHSLHPGSGSVLRAMTSVDWLLKEIRSSSQWNQTAVVVVFDESGGWWDHVPPPQMDSQGLGARVPMLVISPYAKKGHISHVQMDHVSILSFIQWNWGLQPLNERNRASGNILDMFEFRQ